MSQQDQELDVVQHPKLGELKFPKSMPYEERNRMIADMEAKAAAPVEQPGFLKRTAQSLGVPTSMNEVKGMSDQFNPIQHPSNLLSPAMPILRGYASNLGSRVKDMARESVDAGENIGNGQPVIPNLGKAAYGGMKAVNAAVPFIGENANNLGDDVANKNYSGAAGDVVGTMGAVAGPEILGKGGKILKSNSYDMMNNVLGTYGRDKKFAINPGRGVVQEGIVSGSKEGLVKKIGEKIPEKAQELNDVVNAPQYQGMKLDIRRPVTEPFQEARQTGSQGVASTPYLNRLVQTQREFMMNRRFSPKSGGYVETGPRDLGSMSPQEVLDYKRSVGTRTNWVRDAIDESINPTVRKIYGGVNSKFESAIPEAAPINERLADLTTAKDVMGKTINRRMTEPGLSTFKDVPPVIVGGTVGGPIGAGAGYLASRATGSPLVKSLAAQGMYQGGRLLQSPFRGAPVAMRLANPEDEEERLRLRY